MAVKWDGPKTGVEDACDGAGRGEGHGGCTRDPAIATGNSTSDGLRGRTPTKRLAPVRSIDNFPSTPRLAHRWASDSLDVFNPLQHEFEHQSLVCFAPDPGLGWYFPDDGRLDAVLEGGVFLS